MLPLCHADEILPVLKWLSPLAFVKFLSHLVSRLVITAPEMCTLTMMLPGHGTKHVTVKRSWSKITSSLSISIFSSYTLYSKLEINIT